MTKTLELAPCTQCGQRDGTTCPIKGARPAGCLALTPARNRSVASVRIGDVLEWLAGAAFTVSAYLATQLAWTAVAVAGVCLAYFAQCYSTHPVRISRPRWLRLPKRKQAES